ncbi:MAG: hypothetical protein ACFB5Z_01570 [Elainellaceae cyanobacterium]
MACTSTFSGLDTEVPLPKEQVNVPEEVEVGGGIVSAAADLLGETITVSTKVTEIVSPNLFTIYDIESLRGEETLAITSLEIPEVGTNIEVTGKVEELDEATIRAAYSIELEPDVVDVYVGRPYVAVQAIEVVD